MAASWSPDASAFMEGFSSTMALLDPIAARTPADKADKDAQKRLSRAKILRNVISAKLPSCKLDDLKTMTSEWLHGMLEASYPFERELVDDLEHANPDDLAQLTALLDGAAECVGRLCGLFALAGRLKSGGGGAEGDDGSGAAPSSAVDDHSQGGGQGDGDGDGDADADADGDGDGGGARMDRAAAAELVRAAVASGAGFQEVVPSGVPGTQVLGADMYEALCWRRGALRYYVASGGIQRAMGGAADGSDGAEVNRRAGRAAAPHASLIEASVDCLQLLLDARLDASAPPADRELPRVLQYGVYSDTHLLALAFISELAYWRWAAAELGAGAGAGAGEASESEARGDADGTARRWFGRAAVAVHRYLHTVDVLMEGCMWSTKRSRELLRLLGCSRHDVRAALEAEVGVEEREMAALKLAEGQDAADGGGAGGGDGGMECSVSDSGYAGGGGPGGGSSSRKRGNKKKGGGHKK